MKKEETQRERSAREAVRSELVGQLEHIRLTDMMSEALMERIARLKSAMTNCSRSLREAVDTSVRDVLLDQIAELDRLEREYVSEVLELEHSIKAMRELLSGLSIGEQRVIELRYFDGRKWEEVAERSNYEMRYCFKLRDRALKKLVSTKMAAADGQALPA